MNIRCVTVIMRDLVMNNKPSLIIILLLTIALGLNAKTVEWSVYPKYESIKPYAEDLYLCSLNGKWGLIDSKGEIILQPDYDFISGTQNGFGLFGVKERGLNCLKGIVTSKGECSFLSEKLYLTGYSVFSEGKLCVANAAGKQGFINESGHIVVKCQFDVVRPFNEGLASIKKGSWVYYIKEDYDANHNNVVYCQWRNGEITFGSSFKNGEAVVGYGSKYKVINAEGKELRNYKASNVEINKYNYTIISPNERAQQNVEYFVPQYNNTIKVFTSRGKYGFSSNDGIILNPVLNNASQVNEHNISIVNLNGKTGLLKIIDGNIDATLNYNGKDVSLVKLGSNGRDKKLQYTITIPQQYIGHTRLLIDNGNGNMQDVSSSVSQVSNVLSYDFVSCNDDIVAEVKCKLIYDGIEVYDSIHELSFMNIKISQPKVATYQADEKNGIQNVYSVISNESKKSVTITATLTVDCKLNSAVSKTFELIIPAKSSKRVSVPVQVKTVETVSATIKLSTGDEKSSKVKVRCYDPNMKPKTDSTPNPNQKVESEPKPTPPKKEESTLILPI